MNTVVSTQWLTVVTWYRVRGYRSLLWAWAGFEVCAKFYAKHWVRLTKYRWVSLLQLLSWSSNKDLKDCPSTYVCYTWAFRAYTRLKREVARIGLRINATKTKYLLAGDSDHLGSSVLVDGDILEVVKAFYYLGTIVTSDNDISSKIRRRIVQGNRAYYGLHRLLRSRRLRARTKWEIYRTLIRPVVLYAHESWTIRAEDANALGVFERHILRTTCVWA